MKGRPTTKTDPTEITLQFNDCNNARDLGGQAALMTQDHVFIDSSDEVVRSKAPMVAGREAFFAAYPDYRNHFEVARGEMVVVSGRSLLPGPGGGAVAVNGLPTT